MNFDELGISYPPKEITSKIVNQTFESCESEYLSMPDMGVDLEFLMTIELTNMARQKALLSIATEPLEIEEIWEAFVEHYSVFCELVDSIEQEELEQDFLEIFMDDDDSGGQVTNERELVIVEPLMVKKAIDNVH